MLSRLYEINYHKRYFVGEKFAYLCHSNKILLYAQIFLTKYTFLPYFWSIWPHSFTIPLKFVCLKAISDGFPKLLRKWAITLFGPSILVFVEKNEVVYIFTFFLLQAKMSKDLLLGYVTHKI